MTATDKESRCSALCASSIAATTAQMSALTSDTAADDERWRAVEILYGFWEKNRATPLGLPQCRLVPAIVAVCALLPRAPSEVTSYKTFCVLELLLSADLADAFAEVDVTVQGKLIGSLDATVPIAMESVRSSAAGVAAASCLLALLARATALHTENMSDGQETGAGRTAFVIAQSALAQLRDCARVGGCKSAPVAPGAADRLVMVFLTAVAVARTKDIFLPVGKHSDSLASAFAAALPALMEGTGTETNSVRPAQVLLLACSLHLLARQGADHDSDDVSKAAEKLLVEATKLRKTALHASTTKAVDEEKAALLRLAAELGFDTAKTSGATNASAAFEQLEVARSAIEAAVNAKRPVKGAVAGALQKLTTAFETVDSACPSLGVASVAVLVPGLAGLISRVVDRECRAAVSPSLSSSSAPDQHDRQAADAMGSLFDLYLPLVQQPGRKADTGLNLTLVVTNGFASRSRQLFRQLFGFCSGAAPALKEYLVAERPFVGKARSDEGSTKNKSTPRADVRQRNLLSAWHLFQALCQSSAEDVASLWVLLTAVEAVFGFISFFVELEEVSVQLLLASPACVENIITVLDIVSGAAQQCASFLDNVHDNSGRSPVAKSGELLFPESMLAAVATVVSTGAAGGSAGIVAAGLDALCTMAEAYPYAASLAIDFDFLVESLELWQVAADEEAERASAAANDDDSHEAPKASGATEDKKKTADRNGSMTVRDCMTLGTLRVMTAMVRQVPQAVNFEWIEILANSMRLLAFHRSGPKCSSEGEPTLHDAFAEALLPCVLASVQVCDDCQEYLLDEDMQGILSEELVARRSYLVENVKDDHATAQILSFVLLIMAHFPKPLSDSIRAAIDRTFPKADEPGLDVNAARALATVLNGHDEELNVDFLARATHVILKSFAKLSLLNDPCLSALAVRFGKAGADARRQLLESIVTEISTDDTDDERTTCAALGLSFVAVSMLNADAGTPTMDEWDQLVRVVNTVAARVTKNVGASAPQLTMCRQALLLLKMLAASPEVSGTVVNAVFLKGRAPFESPLLAVLLPLLEGPESDLAGSGRASPAAFLRGTACAVVETALSLASAKGDMDAVLESAHWWPFMDKVILAHVNEPSCASSLFVLLNYTEIRQRLIKDRRREYEGALATVEKGGEASVHALRLSVYRQELSQ